MLTECLWNPEDISNPFSPSMMWVPGIKPKWAVSPTNTLTHRAVSRAQDGEHTSVRQILSQRRKLEAQTHGQEGGRAGSCGTCELTPALLPGGWGLAFRGFTFPASPQPLGVQLHLGAASDGYLWLGEASSETPLINYEGRHMWVRTRELGA